MRTIGNSTVHKFPSIVVKTSVFIQLQDAFLTVASFIALKSLRGYDPVKSFSEAILRADMELTNRQNVIRRGQLGPVYGDMFSRPQKTVQNDYVPRRSHVHSKVDMQDVNAAIIYALSNEVGRRSELVDKEFEALRVFIRSVLKHLPVRPDISAALRGLHAAMLGRSSISGTKILSVLRESGLDYSDSRIIWANCRASVPDRRGYPCGLWQVFHTLSVRAYEQSLNGGPEVNTFGPDGVLTAIIGYIKHLFTCGECSENFMKSVQHLQKSTLFVSHADAVLLIWRAHNTANRHLAGDFSEDPLYPKVQFPTFPQCAWCRTNHDVQATLIIWDEPNVLRFLQQFYGSR